MEDILLGITKIDVSGQECSVEIWRNKRGNIEIMFIDRGIYSECGWLSEGTTEEIFNGEIVISQFKN